ncbi:MAG: aldo/keto reductase [Turicibacter sp.]|nr:aldo/keto reductase [Turicibacter sp.]
MAQVALRLLIQRGISVIPKSSHKSRLIENMEIFDFELTAENMNKIRSLNQGETLFGWH